MSKIQGMTLALLLAASGAVAQMPSTPAPATPAPPPPQARRGLEVKYMRDSAEYATITSQIYRVATAAVEAEAKRRAAAGIAKPWGVVLDVDETTLDNSVYELERAAYDLPYEPRSWAAWIGAASASTVPGVKPFLEHVRAAGGHVIFITDRDADLTADNDVKVDGVKATRENLDREGLWKADDILCLRNHDTKVVRRAAVANGEERCSWKRTPLDVIAFFGDQMTDFPQKGETLFPGAGMDDAFGKRFFLLPNSMYGGAVGWTNTVTRNTRSFTQTP